MKIYLQNHCPTIFGWLADWRDSRPVVHGEPELALVPALCPAGETAFDVGANSGTYTYRMLRLAGKVLAFEPNPRLCAVLSSRFSRAIAAGRLIVEPIAASTVEGSAELFIPNGLAALASLDSTVRTGAQNHGETFSVRTARLDGFDDGKVGFIKIDVEGHEIAVIDGAHELLLRDHPNLLIEAEERHHAGTIARLRQRLEPLGYRGAYLHEGRLHPLATFDAATLQNRSALNESGTYRLPGRVYINNFIFSARPGVLEGLGLEQRG